MSKTVLISSAEQFRKLLDSSTLVVADFYADWSGPCKVIAPIYEALSKKFSRPNKVTFTKVNFGQQQELAGSYGVTATPTFLIFKNGNIVHSVRGTDVQQLTNGIQSFASELAAVGQDSNGGVASAVGDSNVNWLGGNIPKGYEDVSDQVDTKGIDLLNCNNEIAPGRVLFEASKPSGLATPLGEKGKAKADQITPDWVESDTDEQMMIFMPFQSFLKIHSLQITSLSPPAAGEEQDDIPMRPRTLKLYINRPHVIGFEEADDIEPTQTVILNPQDWDAKTCTAKVELRFVKFQHVSSLVIFCVDCDGDGEKIRLDRIRIFGEAGEKRAVGKLEKIGDEQGE